MQGYGHDPSPRLSIVIPTYNGRAVLRECLHSILRHQPAGAEVIVVDDGSNDGTSLWLQAEHPWVRRIHLRGNHGFCVAINAGIRAARAPVIETLNNDTVVTADWAESALQLFEDPTVGSVAPLVWLLREQGLIDSAGDQYHLCGWAMNRAHRQRLGPALVETAEVFGASACAAFFRREALLRAGGFPEHFGAYYDDVDLAFRLRRAGYRCLYTPRSQVYHRLHHSYDHHDPAVVSRIGQNEERVFWTNLPSPLLKRALLPHLLYVVCNLMGRWVNGQHPLAYLRGKLFVLQEVRAIRRQRRHLRALARQTAVSIRLPIETDSTILIGRIRNGLSIVFRLGEAQQWLALLPRPRRILRWLARAIRRSLAWGGGAMIPPRGRVRSHTSSESPLFQHKAEPALTGPARTASIGSFGGV